MATVVLVLVVAAVVLQKLLYCLFNRLLIRKFPVFSPIYLSSRIHLLLQEYGVAIIHNLSLKFIAPNQEDPSNNGEYDSEVPLKCVAAEQLLEELR